MSLHARQPTLLRMVMDPAPPTPPLTSPSTPTQQDANPNPSPNRTELEPTPLLLALDMAAERKRLRKRVDSVVTGATTNTTDEDEYVAIERTDAGEVQSGEGVKDEDAEDGKEVIIVVKEDLSQLAVLGRSVSEGFWNGVEGVRKGVWGVVGWS